MQKFAVAALGNTLYGVGKHLARDTPLMPQRLIPNLSEVIIKGSPCLILFGNEDILTPEKTSRRVYNQLLANGESVKFELLNGGHCTLLKNDREKYISHVDSFLASTLQ